MCQFEPRDSSGVQLLMKRSEPTLDWPAWSNWALAAVVFTIILTIVATINDIW